jgi:hypothetical protein
MQAHTRTAVALLAGTLLVATAVPSGQQRSLLTPGGTISILESYLEAIRQQIAIPAMSAAVVKDGVIVWEKGYGFQNVATRLRATPDTPCWGGRERNARGGAAPAVCRAASSRARRTVPDLRPDGAGADAPSGIF